MGRQSFLDFAESEGGIDGLPGLDSPVETFASWARSEHPFGAGVCMCCKEPEAFGSKRNVLLNNYWPRLALDPKDVSALEAGPKDPRNKEVCTSIIFHERYVNRADFCVPVLVPEACAFEIFSRLVPELEALGVGSGCNRWGERQWPDRDVWVVQLDKECMSNIRQECGFACSLEMASKRLAFLRREQSSDHPEALRQGQKLAQLLWGAGRHADSLALQRSVCDGWCRTMGMGHADTLKATSLLATMFTSTGDNAEAEPLLWQALRGWESACGEHSGQTMDCLVTLSATLVAMERYGEAEPLLWRALEGREALLGRAHPDTLNTLSDLAVNLQTLGRHVEAEPLRLRAKYGELHPDFLASLENLASHLEADGCASEALHLRRRTKALAQLTRVTRLLEQDGRSGEAQRLRDQVLDGAALLLSEPELVEEAEERGACRGTELEGDSVMAGNAKGWWFGLVGGLCNTLCMQSKEEQHLTAPKIVAVQQVQAETTTTKVNRKARIGGA
jgi:tetratricopeptide (TPR) repeat protein